MRNIWLITKREYLTQVKKKSFLVFTLMAPVLIFAFGAFITFMLKANETNYNIQVIDKSGVFKTQLKSDETIKYSFSSENTEKSLRTGLKDLKEIDGLLIIGKIVNTNFSTVQKNTELLVNNKIGFDAKQNIVSDLSDILKLQKIKQLQLTQEQIKNLDEKFDLKTKNINDNTSIDTDLQFGVKYGLGIVLMYATFMFIIIYGVRVMRSVLEEKNNRVVEILISSVKPFQLMMGKIFGVTMVALTQFLVWIFMAVISAVILNRGFSAVQKQLASTPSGAENLVDMTQLAMEASHHLLSLNFPLIILLFIFFFIFGYLFYSSMYAAIGSAVDNETETQQFTLFAMIPLMIGIYGSFTIINNPDGPMGFWLSIIPFTSPVAMMARIPFGVPTWQIILSMVLLVTSTFGMIYLASKIYKIGILKYGNKATLKELWKWIRD